MKTRACLFVLTALATGALTSCSLAPAAPAAPSYQARWAAFAKPAFSDLLASYGASNVQRSRSETLDNYLRSQTKTYDRYVAAKEVGIGVDALQQEALSEIQVVSASLPSRSFLVRAAFSVQTYDPQLGGFPLYQQPFDLDASIRYVNDDVRTASSTSRGTRGMVVADAYGFQEAEVWFSKVGWVVPATQDQAVHVLEALSRSGGERKIAVAMTYSLDRCDASDSNAAKLVCRATVRSMTGYSSLDGIRPDQAPVVELVNRGG